MNETKNEIDVTVKILTYYHENYIAQAIESVLMQKTSLRYEILVGDDASGDKTPEIIMEYASRYPDVIVPVLRKTNIGATANGLHLSRLERGKYIADLEGDDFWLDPFKMQKQYDFLEANPQFFGCCGKCLVVDENGVADYTQMPKFVENKKVFTIQDYLERWNLAGQVGTMMHRRAPEREYSEAFRLHRNVGDKTGALIQLSFGPYYCSNEILSAYRSVQKKDGHNHFSQHLSNPYRHYDMFMYPCRLEAWGKKRLGLDRKVRLGPRRDYRFCRFVEETAKDPSLKRLKCLGEMMIASRQPAKYGWLTLKTLIEME